MMVRRCDADGNGYICSEEFHDLCQEFDISQASSRWTAPPPLFFPSVVTIDIQYYTWMLPFLQCENSFEHLWTVTVYLVSIVCVSSASIFSAKFLGDSIFSNPTMAERRSFL
jgi:hypothetical protein